MGNRRKSRESTLQILFQIEFDDSGPENILDQFWKGKKAQGEVKEYCRWLVMGIISNQDALDRIIQSASEHWRLSRMPIVDRNILRMAVFELFYGEDLAPAIVIDESLEIAKKFSSEQAAPFVNGILDALLRQQDKIKEKLKEDPNG
ncbi:MAG: transcription antitermination factor NusB [Candidatus Aminicenantes bacterium]|nr:transcription antitermination factor NusB [Candidatus Aminicenantes bacterium]